MSKIKIIDCSTGSYNYLPKELQDRYSDIDIIPVGLHFLGQDYWETDPNFDPHDYYERLKPIKKQDIPRTIPPSPEMIKDIFLKAADEGYDTILVFTLSSYLSGLFNTLNLVGEMEEVKSRIKVIPFDTHCVCVNEFYLALHAHQRVKEGASIEEILEELNYMKYNQEFMAVEGTLDFLIYNGRLKGAKAVFGKMLNMCPIVGFNAQDGSLGPLKSVRTQRRSLDEMWGIYEEKIKGLDPSEYVSWIIYTGKDMLPDCRRIALENHGVSGLSEYVMSPTSGSHNGPYFCGFGLIRLPKGAKKYDI